MTYNRETCTDAEWRAFYLANYPAVLAYDRTHRRTLPPGLWRVLCPFCQSTYITSDTEQAPTCSDCLFNARDIARECERARTAVQAKRQRDDHESWVMCVTGYCEHQFGPEGCYLALQRSKHGPAF
jgi:hypothetical protein